MGARRGRLSTPWLRFHGGGAADVYIIIRVRANRCGESALNPPPSPPIPRRSPSARPRTATRPSRTLPLPRPATMHARRPHHPFPAEDLLPPQHSDTPFPSTSARPRSPDAHPPTSQHIPRRKPAPASAQRHPLPEHFRPPTQPRRTPASCAMHSSPTSQHISRRRSAPAPAQRHALPEHFSSPSPRRRTPAGCAMHSSPPSQHISRRRSAPAPAQRRALPLPSCHIPAAQTHAHRPHHPFPTEDLRPPPHSDAPCPSTFSLPPRSPDARPRSAALPPPPSVPLRAQKNGTAQWMCDAECLGRPSLRSVIGVGEPRAVRRRCGALAWRVGLRPQPWALRSRRCGRVLRA